MARRARPLGVTLLALLQFLVAGVLLLRGLVALAGGQGTLDPMTQELVEKLGGSQGTRVVFFFSSVLAAFINAALGWGLWTLRTWARTVAVFLLYVGIVGTLIGLLWVPLHVGHGFNLAFSALLIWYLSRARVRAAFTPATAETDAATTTGPAS